MINCQHDNCRAQATHSVLTKMPLMYWPAEFGIVQIYLGIELCFKHALDLVEQGIEFPDDSKERISTSIAAERKLPPDFKRAEFEVVALNSPGYIQYQELAKGINQ